MHADTHSKVYMPAPVPGAACPAKVSWVLVGAAKAVNSPCWAWIERSLRIVRKAQNVLALVVTDSRT